MNLQELLTYVEELAFKNSMFGYDKDEVDIQLDKICDEVEALVSKKDKEIEELKKAIATGAPVPAEPVVEKAPAAEPAVKGVPVEEYAAVVSECEQLKSALAEANAALKAAKEDAEHADEAARLMLSEVQKVEARMSIKESEEHAAKAKLAGLRNEIAALKAELEVQAAEVQDREPTLVVPIEEEPVEEPVTEEPVEEILRAPSNTDEAYTQYMRYADLLCQQLAEVETKHSKIVAEATTEADQIRTAAQNEADGILAEANAVLADKTAEATNTAEDILSAAKEEADSILFTAKTDAEGIVKAAKEEAEQIGQEYIAKAAQAEESCKVLAQKKESLVESLSGFGAEIAALVAKMQGGAEVAEATEVADTAEEVTE